MEVYLLDNENVHLFRGLFLPGHLQKLQSLGQHILGLGIIFDHHPIGVSLIELDDLRKQIKVFHFMVKTGEAQLGCMELLLKETEELVASKGYDQYVLHLQLDRVEQELFDVFLQRGWKGPSQQIDTYICDTQLLMKETWMSQLRKVDFVEVWPWSVVPENILAKLATGVNDWYPEKFSPLRDRENIDLETSFALFYRGELAGWIIGEKVARNMILVRILFVRNIGKARNGVMILLAEVIKNAAFRNCYAMFFVEKDNFSMNTIVAKRLRQGVIKEKSTLQFEK